MAMSNVGKLKASGLVVFTDLPPALNLRKSGLLSKSRKMKTKGGITSPGPVKKVRTYGWRSKDLLHLRCLASSYVWFALMNVSRQ